MSFMRVMSFMNHLWSPILHLKSFLQLIKARELERARAMREGKMDDPNIPKRLEDAITMVGTCQDMCPEFERYRRERENNLDKWECVRLISLGLINFL